MKKVLAFLSVLALVGCGSDSDSGRNAVLADLIGTWDASSTYGQEVDEIYTVIKEDGSFIDYDYDGDSYDQGDNCYYRYEAGVLTDQGNGDFLIESNGEPDSVVKVKISGSRLTISSSFGSSTSTKINRSESDFTPLCTQFI